jgi:lysophospholipase L1-like esterase
MWAARRAQRRTPILRRMSSDTLTMPLPRQRTRNFLRHAAAWIISFAVMALLGEVIVRLTLKDQERAVLYPRYQTGYQYGPYTLRGIWPDAHFRHTSIDGSWEFVTNNRGFRDTRDFPYAKPVGTLRVLALGDSHTQGYEVRQEATFSAVLERYLRTHGMRAEVLNAGVSGFGTAEELAFLENEGYRYQPDVVVVAFYANDFEDNLKADLFGLDKGGLVEHKHEHLPGVRIQNMIYSVPGARWLSENSYFYSFLLNNVWEYFKARLARNAVTEYAIATQSASKYEVDLALALLERMQRYCREHGMRLIVVDIPSEGKGYQFADSLPSAAQRALQGQQIEFVSSESLFADYRGTVPLHVPHGQQHISELTHAAIGVELGRLIARAP